MQFNNILFVREKCKLFFSQNKKCENCLRKFREETNAIFLGKQNAKILQQIRREIIDYDLRKLQMLNSQSREFHKFL